MAKTSIVLIGSGRVAKHLGYYFTLLGVNYVGWNRRSEKSLRELVNQATHAILAISDSAIADLSETLSGWNPDLRIVHLSGAHADRIACVAHPLMSFGGDYYTEEEYRRIPFITEKGAPDLTELIPGIPNAHFALEPRERSRYHALCVMAGNFSVMLWRTLFSEFENRFGIPQNAAYPYLERVAFNLIKSPESALTGPLVREEWETVNQNLAALGEGALADIYRAFIRLHHER